MLVFFSLVSCAGFWADSSPHTYSKTMIHVIINMFLFDLLLLKKCFGDTFFWGIDTVFTTTRFLPHNVNTKGFS